MENEQSTAAKYFLQFLGVLFVCHLHHEADNNESLYLINNLSSYWRFPMIYLYIKTHNITGLKYLGKTVQDPYVYKGSGKRWLNHIKVHGHDVTTEIIGQYNTIEEFRFNSVIISEKYDIVNSKEWANLRIENGDGGDTSQFIDYSQLNRGKGKTYEERYGIDKAIQLKEVRRATIGNSSSKRKGKSLIDLYGSERAADITKLNSQKHKAKRGPHTEDRKRKISESKQGKAFSKMRCPVCDKFIGLNNVTKHQRIHIQCT